MEYEFDMYEQAELTQFLRNDEPECECRFCGDSADASDCDLHSRRVA